MTTDTKLAPTDAEIFVVAREAGLLPDNSHPAPETRVGRKHSNAVQAFARAVLARWGQPAHSREPVAWLNPWRADQVTTDCDAYGEHGIALYTAPKPSPAAQGDALDTIRLDWLDADESRCVFHLGKSWYTRPSYGMPYRKRASLREAIDAARAAQEGKK